VAASYDGLKYGLGESLITAQLPLVVRFRLVHQKSAHQCAFKWPVTLLIAYPLSNLASPPRFLNFGDHCELVVVIQNQLDESLDVM